MHNILEQPIASGHLSEVYAWEGNTVLKLFRPEFSQDLADYEVEVSRKVELTGIRIPKMEGVVTVNGRKGIVYERVHGPSMAEAINQNPLRAAEYARLLARMHVELHQKSGEGLPSFYDQLLQSIREAKILTETQRQRALQRATGLPAGDRLCHGDFHLSNIILTDGGPVVLDWFCCGEGHPAADVTRTYIILSRCGAPPAGMPRWQVELGRRVISRVYLDYYRRHVPEVVGQMKIFLPVVAAAKLNDNILPEQGEIQKLLKGL